MAKFFYFLEVEKSGVVVITTTQICVMFNAVSILNNAKTLLLKFSQAQQ